MYASSAPAPVALRPHDPATVLAVAVVVYGLAKVVHEALGHGIACALAGGDLVAVSSSWCACEKTGVGVLGRRWIEAAGTLANLGVGLAALSALLRPWLRSGAAYLFFWLAAAVNLLVAGGYLMVDPLFGFGDWGDFLAGLEPALPWRLGLTGVGVAVSLGTFFALRPPLERLLGGEERDRRRQARLLCWWPYLAAGGVVLTGAAALNAYGPRYAFTSALATLGGTFLLLWLPVAVGPAPEPAVPPRFAVGRSPAWLLAGGAMLAFLALAFGPGIRL